MAGGWLFPADAVSSAPNYTARAAAEALSAVLAGGTTARPFGALSGVRPLVTQPCSVVGLTVTIGPHAGVLDLETSNLSGARFYGFDQAQTITISALPSSPNTRIDLISVQQNDHTEDGSATAAPVITYTAGTAANPGVAPSLPARNMLLAVVNVTSTTSSITWVAPNTVAAGGILPAASSAYYPVTPTEGMYVDDAALNALMRYTGSGWVVAAASFAERTQEVEIIPGGTASTPASGTATWAATSGLVVPAWATSALIHYDFVNMTMPATALNVNLQLKIGTAAGRSFRIPSTASATANFCWGYTDRVSSGLSAGAQNLNMVATFVGGSGVFSMTTGSLITFLVEFLP